MAQANPNILAPGQTDPLAQLRDIHMPGAIDTWPPAPGWWMLGALGLVIIAAALFWLYRRWKANQYRREGLLVLDALKRHYDTNRDAPLYLAEYSALLKRVALTRFSRDHVASLTGEAWVQFLDRAANTDEFTMGAGQALIAGNYQPNPDIDVERLHELGMYWIRHHRMTEAAL